MQKERASPRQRTLKGATISFNQATIDCVLRNVSETGACLEVASPIGIPNHFTLIIKNDHTVRLCHVAWRTAQRIGVRFE
jgi:hypothetical protein